MQKRALFGSFLKKVIFLKIVKEEFIRNNKNFVVARMAKIKLFLYLSIKDKLYIFKINKVSLIIQNINIKSH